MRVYPQTFYYYFSVGTQPIVGASWRVPLEGKHSPTTQRRYVPYWHSTAVNCCGLSTANRPSNRVSRLNLIPQAKLSCQPPRVHPYLWGEVQLMSSSLVRKIPSATICTGMWRSKGVASSLNGQGHRVWTEWSVSNLTLRRHLYLPAVYAIPGTYRTCYTRTLS